MRINLRIAVRRIVHDYGVFLNFSTHTKFVRQVAASACGLSRIRVWLLVLVCLTEIAPLAVVQSRVDRQAERPYEQLSCA
jgi:hypothetical protein